MSKFDPWLAIRKPLSPQRQALLTVVSFLLPIFVWCIVSYIPWLWHPDMVVTVSADRHDVTTVYSVGDRLPRHKESEDDFAFVDFVEDVRERNEEIQAARDSGEPMESSRRANKKVLRHLAPVGIAEGWLTRDQATDDTAIYTLWGEIARGEKQPSKVQLSQENLAVVRDNWSKVGAISETYDSKKIPTEILLNLIPQGKPSNPVFVPAPHEVVQTGIYDWTHQRDPDKPAMFERYGHSLTIVFSGFLLSCLFGVPLGILSGTYDFFAKIVEPFTDFFRYMPAPAFSTILVAILSVYDAPKIGLVFLGTYFQMVLVISNTTRTLDRSLLEAAQTLGAKSKDMMFRVIIPGIMPKLYNDLRILLGWAWTWLVIAELIGTKSGLTEFIETQGRFRNFDSVYPTIIIIGLTGYVTDQILAALRPLFFPWDPQHSSQKLNVIIRFFKWLTNSECYVKSEQDTKTLTSNDQ
ncbi:MAG: ABC transporter permease [Verrucomicrobiota bacterium]